ncbi:MAG: chemotaxis protein CheW [Sporolactobacillus sp.]
MDMSQYLGVFVDEAREHLQNLNDKLMELEEKQDDPELINSIFRSAHTLKGSSGQMGFENMMELTHTMENVFDALRHHTVTVNSAMVDCLFETTDVLEAMIDAIASGGNDQMDVQNTKTNLQKLLTAGGAEAAVATEEKASPSAEKEEKQPGRMNFDEYDRSMIDQALAGNLNVFEAAVTLRQDCVLKAARALIVSNALEDLGSLIKSDPPAEAIEKEEFDRQFSYLLITDANIDQVRSAILNISEIEKADVFLVKNEQETESAKPEAQASTAPSAKKDSGPSKSSAPKKIAVSKTIRVNLDRLDSLLNLFEEMIIDRSRLEKITDSIDNNDLKESVASIKRVSNQLQETILNLRMEPVEQVFNRFPRMVRSLSKELNKKVNLVISGEETELDRTVIDELGDPLMHMIRNSMDHGIEHPEIRKEIGKPEEGTLAMRAYHSGNHVFIEIEDDGAGINREKVLGKAIEKGIVTEQAAETLTDKEIYHLLFESGFSTADKISDISGRGVGLDVVESKIHSLSGTVEVDSSPNKGSKFTVKLPLTLSIINALLIQSGQEIYAVPITMIHETALRRQTKVQMIQNQQVTRLRDHVIPLINLSDYLDIPAAPQEEVGGSIVYIKSGDRIVGLQTEKLLGYQDIVIKPLSVYLKDVDGFSGATILGDGKVALILDCQSLIQKQKKKQMKQSV